MTQLSEKPNVQRERMIQNIWGMKEKNYTMSREEWLEMKKRWLFYEENVLLKNENIYCLKFYNNGK